MEQVVDGRGIIIILILIAVLSIIVWRCSTSNC